MPFGLTSSLHDSGEEMHGASFGQEFVEKGAQITRITQETFSLSLISSAFWSHSVFIFAGSVDLSQAFLAVLGDLSPGGLYGR